MFQMLIWKTTFQNDTQHHVIYHLHHQQFVPKNAAISIERHELNVKKLAKNRETYSVLNW